MKSSLEKLPSILGLDDVEKGFYAWRLADREPELNYHGKIPPTLDFGIDRMMKDKQEKFMQWYTPRERDPHFVYDMKAEALKYCQ